MDIKKSNLKENVVHGNAMLPFYIYINKNNGYSLYWHWHEEIEIIYVDKGDFIFNVDMVPVKVSEGQCIFINKEQLHSASSPCNDITLHHAIVFHLNFLSSAIYDYCQSKYIDPLIKGLLKFPLLIDKTSPWGKKVLGEVKAIIAAYDEKSMGWELDIKASLFKIISIISKDNKFEISGDISSPTKKYKVEIIKKTLSFIHLNYSNKIYIEHLAREVNMNPQYFCRFFKANTGKTPVEYITHYRIEQASRIIQTEDKKILDIALEVGFENFSYFIKKFKEYKKCTPSKFKELSS